MLWMPVVISFDGFDAPRKSQVIRPLAPGSPWFNGRRIGARGTQIVGAVNEVGRRRMAWVGRGSFRSPGRCPAIST